MIYITQIHDKQWDMVEVSNVWECDKANIKDLYMKFLLSEANSKNIVINEHRFNIMNFENWHKHLTKAVYKQKEKEWNKFLKSNNVDWFIEVKLLGKKVSYQELNI